MEATEATEEGTEGTEERAEGTDGTGSTRRHRDTEGYRSSLLCCSVGTPVPSVGSTFLTRRRIFFGFGFAFAAGGSAADAFIPGSGRRLSGGVCCRSRMKALMIFNAARASRSVRCPLK